MPFCPKRNRPYKDEMASFPSHLYNGKSSTSLSIDPWPLSPVYAVVCIDYILLTLPRLTLPNPPPLPAPPKPASCRPVPPARNPWGSHKADIWYPCTTTHYNHPRVSVMHTAPVGRACRHPHPHYRSLLVSRGPAVSWGHRAVSGTHTRPLGWSPLDASEGTAPTPESVDKHNQGQYKDAVIVEIRLS